MTKLRSLIEQRESLYQVIFASSATKKGDGIGYRFGYKGVLRDWVQKNRCKVLTLQRLCMGGTGLEPVTSTV